MIPYRAKESIFIIMTCVLFNTISVKVFFLQHPVIVIICWLLATMLFCFSEE